MFPRVYSYAIQPTPSPYSISPTCVYVFSAVIIRLFVLPTVPSEVGPVATLPAKEESILPRAKPVPVPKVQSLA